MNSLLERAKKLDASDVLAHKIDEFYLPDGLIYLDGNSLGPLSYAAQARVKEVVELQWGQSLIESWNSHNWISLPATVGDKIAPLLGAPKGSVVSCDSISVNLFKLLSAGLMYQQGASTSRPYILSQSDNFPTDLYMVQGLSQLMGKQKCELLSVPSHDIQTTLLEKGEQISVLMLSHVNFKNGDIIDIQAITELAHSKGVLVLWDVAHSAGVLPLQLEQWKVDFAVGCSYKYLNGGPGAPGFAYVAPALQAKLQQPLSGWMGHKAPFSFDHQYEKAPGIEQLLAGTPSIISMSTLEAALSVFDTLSVHTIRDKSIALNDFFQECIEPLLKTNLLTLACETNAANRGSQISFAHPDAYGICQALIAENVIADFRAPNILRIGFSPLFLSFQNIYDAANILSNIMRSKCYQNLEFQVRQRVT